MDGKLTKDATFKPVENSLPPVIPKSGLSTRKMKKIRLKIFFNIYTPVYKSGTRINKIT
jgi:hypothetical protein